jgi:hypothetical protein
MMDTCYQLHIDSSANGSITPDAHRLLHLKNIKSQSIYGVYKNQMVLTCTEIGYIPLVKCQQK